MYSPTDQLRGHGLRITVPRVAVLEALRAHSHARADEVIEAVRADREVSTQAVYDVLNTLSDRGLVRRIQPRGSVARYELETGDNHHHLVCRECGQVSDVPCATGEAPCLDLPHDPATDGFAIDEAEVTWWGLCPTCTSSTDTQGAEGTP